MWTGLSWLKIWSSEGLLWLQGWALKFPNNGEFLNNCHKALYHGDSYDPNKSWMSKNVFNYVTFHVLVMSSGSLLQLTEPVGKLYRTYAHASPVPSSCGCIPDQQFPTISPTHLSLPQQICKNTGEVMKMLILLLEFYPYIWAALLHAGKFFPPILGGCQICWARCRVRTAHTLYAVVTLIDFIKMIHRTLKWCTPK
jgi:hypothetical protein